MPSFRTNRESKKKNILPNSIQSRWIAGKLVFIIRNLHIVGPSLLLIMLFVGGDFGWIQIMQLSDRLEDVRNRVDILRIKNVDLLSEKSLLVSDDSYRKLIATEKYGMVPKGTVLCRLIK